MTEKQHRRPAHRPYRSNGDAASAELLDNVIYAEEISHCAAGVRWLKHLHALARGDGSSSSGSSGEAAAADAAAAGAPAATDAAAVSAAAGMPVWAAEARRHERVELWFHSLIRAHFQGLLKPPFNDKARAAAGFGPEWYLPISRDLGEAAPAGHGIAAAS